MTRLSFCKTVFFLLICSVWTNSTEAQTMMGKFARLLWYSGTRINDTVIMTKSGRKVTYFPMGQRVISEPTFSDDVYKKLLKRLDEKETRKRTITAVMMKAPKGPRNVGLVSHVNKTLDQVNEGKEVLKKNEVKLTGQVRQLQRGEKIPDWVHQTWGEVMRYVANIRSETSFDPPPPPAKEFDYCYACDSARQRAYRQASEEFISQFLKNELQMIDKATSVMHYFGFQKSRNVAYDLNTAEYMEPDMVNAIIAIRKRIDLKLSSAWTKYGGDVTRIPFLLDLITKQMHSEQVMGIETNDLPSFSDMALQSINKAKEYLAKAEQEKNYHVLLNVRWIVELYRWAELLGQPPTELERSLFDYLTLNQFEVSIDADAKMGGEGTFISSQVTGKNIFNAIPDSNCVLKWTLQSPDLKYMKFKLEKASIEAPEAAPTYVGTKTWRTTPADLKLDFCKDEKDTALFYAFYPDEGKDIWNFPQIGNAEANHVSGLFNSCFMDVELLKKKAAEYSSPEAMARLQKQMMEKYQSAVAPNTGLMTKDPSTMTPEEIEKMSKLMNASADISNIVQLPAWNIFTVKSRLQNNQKLVFEKRLDGKELNPANTGIQYAYFTVKIEHVD